MIKKLTIIILCLSTFSLFALEVPKLSGRVNDYASILSSSEEAELDQILKMTEDKSSSQVVILTIASLEDEVLEDFTIRVVEDWKIGQKDLDNGVLLLIAMREKKLRIEVGYGLEGVLTDAKCSYIIRNLIVTEFKSARFFNGVKAGTNAITGIINKEYDITPEDLARARKKRTSDKSGKHFPFGFVIFIIIILLNFLGRSGKGGRGSGSQRGSSIFWGGGGFGGGGSSFGGGFSGGGGSFGGGGSSGGW